MKWLHNGIKYRTKKIDWFEYIKKSHDFVNNDIMVYNTKWDRCYYIRRLVFDRNRVMAQLCDIYEKDRYAWSNTKYLEFVIKDKI